MHAALIGVLQVQVKSYHHLEVFLPIYVVSQGNGDVNTVNGSIPVKEEFHAYVHTCIA